MTDWEKEFKETFYFYSTTEGTLEQDCDAMTEYVDKLIAQQRAKAIDELVEKAKRTESEGTIRQLIKIAEEMKK